MEHKFTPEDTETLKTLLGYLAEHLESMGDGDDWWSEEEKADQQRMVADTKHLRELLERYG